jgi:hypothetical protein
MMSDRFADAPTTLGHGSIGLVNTTLTVSHQAVRPAKAKKFI